MFLHNISNRRIDNKSRKNTNHPMESLAEQWVCISFIHGKPERYQMRKKRILAGVVNLMDGGKVRARGL
jgi:hypothetical protein